MNGAIETVTNIAPLLVVVLFALPAYISVWRQRGIVGVLIIVVILAYAVGVLALAAKTGIPYGRFTYDSSIGYKLFGIVPWIVAGAYLPILLAAFWLASKFTVTGKRILLAAVFATLMDSMLDPAMVKLEFWQWDNPGVYYGVPIVNFLGWLVIAAGGSALLHFLWGKDAWVSRGLAYSGLLLMLFWMGVNIGTQQWIPAAIGGVVGGLILLLAGIEKWKNSYGGS